MAFDTHKDWWWGFGYHKDWLWRLRLSLPDKRLCRFLTYLPLAEVLRIFPSSSPILHRYLRQFQDCILNQKREREREHNTWFWNFLDRKILISIFFHFQGSETIWDAGLGFRYERPIRMRNLTAEAAGFIYVVWKASWGFRVCSMISKGICAQRRVDRSFSCRLIIWIDGARWLMITHIVVFFRVWHILHLFKDVVFENSSASSAVIRDRKKKKNNRERRMWWKLTTLVVWFIRQTLAFESTGNNFRFLDSEISRTR